MNKAREVVMHRVMENLQESRGYGRWFLGFHDGMHYPPPNTIEDAMQEYEIPEDDEDWIKGFEEGQAAIDWDKVMTPPQWRKINQPRIEPEETEHDWRSEHS
tara:strand:+ start:242 stop:547 length:306 start_codon:yes stop_codon:yes gene_type:complete